MNGSKSPLNREKEEVNIDLEDQKENDKELGIAESDGCVARIFKIIDEDGDGRVSNEEIMKYLEKLNLEIPMEDLESAVKSFSACGYKFLTCMEFKDFYDAFISADNDKTGEFKSYGADMAIREAFSVFDRNGDGFISAIELGDVLCRLGLVEGRDACLCQSMIESKDVNGDGFVDLQEFMHLINRS